MMKSIFGITDEGDVFLLNGGFRKLGSLSYLMSARTPVALEVQQWWCNQMASDGPIENLIEIQERANGRRQYVVRTAAQAMPAVGSAMNENPVAAHISG